MSQQYEDGYRAFPCDAALPNFSRVKLSSGSLVLAGATDAAAEIGTVIRPQYTTGLEVGQPATVRLRNDRGTRKMTAAGAITGGVNVYAAANGQVTATVQGDPIGIALETVTGAGSIVEVLYQPPLPRAFANLSDVLLTSPAQGDIYYSDGTHIVNLPKGTSGTKLTTEGASAPAWT